MADAPTKSGVFRFSRALTMEETLNVLRVAAHNAGYSRFELQSSKSYVLEPNGLRVVETEKSLRGSFSNHTYVAGLEFNLIEEILDYDGAEEELGAHTDRAFGSLTRGMLKRAPAISGVSLSGFDLQEFKELRPYAEQLLVALEDAYTAVYGRPIVVNSMAELGAQRGGATAPMSVR